MVKSLLITISLFLSTCCFGDPPSIQKWAGDLSPIDEVDWTYHTAAHLLERAGFGGTPGQISKLEKLGPKQAVRSFFNSGERNPLNMKFDHSGIHDPELEPFPPSRPAATRLAKETGQAMGVKIKPEGNRRLQPVVDRFFYWLRASRLETNRLSYWWANRMLTNPYPLDEKISLFWHGHFATSEAKVRDYRKMHQQNLLFREKGLGDFRSLLISVAQGPAMLSFLDAGVNIKGSPNENFAREIMELFTMGVGNYSEADIREAARAFTGWNFSNLAFVINDNQRDRDQKTIFGKTKPFNGIEVIDLILEREITAKYIATKLYKFFVGNPSSVDFEKKLGNLLFTKNYNIQSFLETLFLSKDFYGAHNRGNRVKSPVELVISTYKKLDVTDVPGVPDFNIMTKNLGQQLFYPPTVAGWTNGKGWITPGLLLTRGNFVYEVVFPDINFVAPDRYPDDYKIRDVNDRLALGEDVTTATNPNGMELSSMSMLMADRDEDFNTRLGSYRGWQRALQKVKPIARTTANINLSKMVKSAGCSTTQEVIEYLSTRFLSVPIDSQIRSQINEFLENELGTSDISIAESYMEEALRITLHILLSLPEYQLG